MTSPVECSQAVQSFMTRNVMTFSLADSPAEVLRKLVERELSGGPVINPRGQVVGLITSWDFLSTHKFPDLIAMMTRVVRCLYPTDTVEHAATLMQREGINHLPVIDTGHLLKGIVTSDDLLPAIRSLVEENPKLVTELELDPLQSLNAEEHLPPSRRLSRRDRDHLLVMDGVEAVGFITDGQYIRACLKEDGSGISEQDVVAKDVMVSPAYTIGSNADTLLALDLMKQHDIEQLPVLDEEGTLSGLLRARMLLNHYC